MIPPMIPPDDTPDYTPQMIPPDETPDDLSSYFQMILQRISSKNRISFIYS
jgi:hypothetical protein